MSIQNEMGDNFVDWIETQITDAKIGLVNWRNEIGENEVNLHYRSYFEHRLTTLFNVYSAYAYHHGHSYVGYVKFCRRFGSLNELISPELFEG